MSTDSSRSPNPRHTTSTPQNAALQGASLAFAKPAVKPKPEINNYSGKGGALAAAAKAGSGSPPKNVGKSTHETLDQSSLKYQSTGESSASGRGGDLERHNQSRLEPGNGSQYQAKSPSFIAATLAASRSVTPNHTGQLQSSSGQKQNPHPWYPPSSVGGLSPREILNQDLDTTPIAPTTSLIDHFEQRHAPTNHLREGPGSRRASTSASQIPSRHVKSQKSPVQARYRTPSQAPVKSQTAKPEIKSPKPISPVAFSGESKPIGSFRSLPVSQVVPVLSQKQAPSPKSPQPPLSRSPNPVSIARKASMPASQPAIPPSETQKSPASLSKLIPIPSKVGAQGTGGSYASSDDSFVSASDVQPSLPPRRNTVPAHHRMTSSSSVTVDSLANAIVASSLASSRAASPSKSAMSTPPLPPPRRSHIFRSHNDSSRTPSPGKGPQLRTTMRKPHQEEIDENTHRRGHRNLVKKHPHKHHEGDRKRWRDEITERERKRYEAVWASNKGMYTSPSFDGGNEVCNLVVRDIWNRSRLPREVLEEVYALVDRKGEGALGKEEFVVGLWLIDQRLKGRKLPIRVTESVWRSVGILGGIKVKKAR